MFFRRSTRSIVAGKRPRAPQEPLGQDPTPTASLGAEEQETPNKAKFYTEVNKFMDKLNLPRWAWWTIGCAALVFLLAIILMMVGPKNNEPTSESPTLPQIGADQTVISVQADAALTALAEAGDIVQLYASSGDKIEALQYVQVYQPSEEGYLLLLVDSKQATAFVSHDVSTRVVLVSHNDSERAGELLALQARINNPQISLTLPTNITIPLGPPTKLEYTAKINPAEATLPQTQWTSSDPSIVTVQDGIIYGLKVGEATITAKCGDTEAVCAVTVEIPLEEIRLNVTDTVLAVGESLTLIAQLEPQEATNTDISWIVSDPAIATVDGNGTVTAIAPGTVVVSTTNGSVTAKCTIRVGYHAEVVQHDPQTVTLKMGDDYSLKPVVYPSTDLIDELEYHSSNTLVAMTQTDGTILAMNPGTATITIRCGEKTFQVTVTVTAP